MKSSLTLLFALGLGMAATSQNVTIIESQSGNNWADQDTHWEEVAISMGVNADIVPQNTLESLSNLSATDVLVISSGTIDLPTTYYETVRDYVLNGGPVYVQSEFQVSYEGSIVFDSLMRNLDVDFSWISTVSGQLSPMDILGNIATTPNDVDTLGYFNYGLAGSGTGVEPFLEYQGNYFGFCYVDPENQNGTIITISDEDWAWQNQSPELMENILAKLLDYSLSTNGNIILEDETRLYPNPSQGDFAIDLGKRSRNTNITIKNSSGKTVFKQEYQNKSVFNIPFDRPAGGYLVTIKTDIGIETKKLIMK